MIPFIAGFPTVLILVLVITFWVVVTVSGLLIVRRLVPVPVLREHNDVAGFIFAGLGVMYAVLLAFVVTAVWERFERVRDHVDTEAARTVSLYREAAILSAEDKLAFRVAIRDYTVTVMEDEWPEMEQGRPSEEAEVALEQVWAMLQRVEPASPSSITWHSAMVDSLREVTALREIRLAEAAQGLPAVITVLLLLGAIITIVYTYLYGVYNLYGQVAMTALLAGAIAIALAAATVLDSPFRGDTRIDPQPFGEALQIMDRTSLD